ncbi:ferredoxin [Streptomyces sp. NPDC021093]|uniref:ferredoxin n=1 Tax=Streptomyces sp. NPDC021093 TaxID=3365112 RepID=UPI0037AE644E
MQITVDAEVCVGSGQCALAVPDVFDQDETDGTVVLLEASPAEEFHREVDEAVGRCPVRAITATEH